MAADPRIVVIAKDKAEALFGKGRLAEALATYGKIEDHGDKDPRIYLRMGEIARKLGDTEAAIGSYKKASESFIRLGFTVKAIAVCKMILGIDPSRKEVEERLARLHGASAPAPARSTDSPPPQMQPEAAAEDEARPEMPRTPLFSDLTEEEFLSVVRKVLSRELAPGQSLFEQADPGDSIFIVASGEVEVVASGKGSSAVVLATLGEGEVFGEFGFFLDARRSTGVRTAAGATVLELTKADLAEAISRHPRVEQVLFEFYKERVVDSLMALSDLFSPLSPEDRKKVLSTLTRTGVAAGSVIVREGEQGSSMYLIKKGAASVTLSGKDGKASEAAKLGPGDFFGEIALATARPRLATVTAVTDVELVEFSRSLIKEVISKYPEIKGALERMIKGRVAGIIRLRAQAPHQL